jgi:hypothetical protein
MTEEQKPPARRLHVRGQFLPTEDGEFNGNVQTESDFSVLNVDQLAKDVVRAACGLDDYPDPSDDNALVIDLNDLEAVVHRHVTVALERAALASEGPAE